MLLQIRPGQSDSSCLTPSTDKGVCVINDAGITTSSTVSNHHVDTDGAVQVHRVKPKARKAAHARAALANVKSDAKRAVNQAELILAAALAEEIGESNLILLTQTERVAASGIAGQSAPANSSVSGD